MTFRWTRIVIRRDLSSDLHRVLFHREVERFARFASSEIKIKFSLIQPADQKVHKDKSSERNPSWRRSRFWRKLITRKLAQSPSACFCSRFYSDSFLCQSCWGANCEKYEREWNQKKNTFHNWFSLNKYLLSRISSWNLRATFGKCGRKRHLRWLSKSMCSTLLIPMLSRLAEKFVF